MTQTNNLSLCLSLGRVHALSPCSGQPHKRSKPALRSLLGQKTHEVIFRNKNPLLIQAGNETVFLMDFNRNGEWIALPVRMKRHFRNSIVSHNWWRQLAEKRKKKKNLPKFSVWATHIDSYLFSRTNPFLTSGNQFSLRFSIVADIDSPRLNRSPRDISTSNRCPFISRLVVVNVWLGNDPAVDERGGGKGQKVDFALQFKEFFFFKPEFTGWWQFEGKKKK